MSLDKNGTLDRAGPQTIDIAQLRVSEIVSRCDLSVRKYAGKFLRTSVLNASALLSLQKLRFMDTVV